MCAHSNKSFRFGIASVSCVLATSAFAANGDWAMLNFDPHGHRDNLYETVLNTKSVKSLQPVWKADIGDTRSAPAVVNGVVYAGTDDGHLYALDAVTGATVWSVKLGSLIGSSPAVVNQIVYVATHDGQFFALDAASGTQLWSKPLDFASSESPTVSDGRVFIGDDRGILYAFNARSGKGLWKTDQFASGNLDAPAVANGIVYSQSYGGYLDAIDAATGTKLWVVYIDHGIGFGSPLVDGNQVYVNSSGLIQSLNAKTGAQVWESGLGANENGSLALAKGVLYGATEDHLIWRYKADFGQIGKLSDGHHAFNAAPTIANGVLYAVSMSDQLVAAYNATSGKFLWSGPLDARPWVSPVVSNGRLYVAAGSLTAYAPQD